MTPDLSTLDPATRRICARIPQDIWLTLDKEQQHTLFSALRVNSNNHLFSVRSSIRLPGQRYYLTVFFGRERRNLDRLREEGQLDPDEVSMAYIIIFAVAFFASIIVVAVGLYAIKSFLGIDIFDGPSPLHGMFFD